MKQLVTFEVQDGENEYRDYGIYDHKYSDEQIIKHFYGLDNLDEENGWYWRDTSIVRINNAEDIDRDKITKVQVKKIKYEDAKKDLTKYLSHDIRTIMKEKLNFRKRRG